jgi:GNAT superfamily N-acetyltransferase
LSIDNGIKIHIKPPAECSSKELRDFEQLVCAGGEVSTNGLSGLILNAVKLLFARTEKTIGVCGIKRTNIHFRNNIFQKAGVPDLQEKYCVEFGLLYVSPSFRKSGVGSSLIKAAMDEVEETGCFATTRVSNATMHALLKRNGFVRLGNDYKSGNGEYFLSLFAKAS